MSSIGGANTSTRQISQLEYTLHQTEPIEVSVTNTSTIAVIASSERHTEGTLEIYTAFFMEINKHKLLPNVLCWLQTYVQCKDGLLNMIEINSGLYLHIC